MAITPNTTFVTGDVFTAQQANNFPRGVMAYVSGITSPGLSTTETVLLTTPSFTALSGRNYRITYYEPALQTAAGAGNYVTNRIRLTNASGTQYGGGQIQVSGATQVANALTIVIITTLTAGSTVIVGTSQLNTGATNAFRAAGQAAYLMVEDIGTA